MTWAAVDSAITGFKASIEKLIDDSIREDLAKFEGRVKSAIVKVVEDEGRDSQVSINTAEDITFVLDNGAEISGFDPRIDQVAPGLMEVVEQIHAIEEYLPLGTKTYEAK